jgi:hypothetical protein
MDTTKQMDVLKEWVVAQAREQNHTRLSPFEEFSGGVVQLATCLDCNRYSFAKIFFDQDEITGSMAQKCTKKEPRHA